MVPVSWLFLTSMLHGPGMVYVTLMIERLSEMPFSLQFAVDSALACSVSGFSNLG